MLRPYPTRWLNGRLHFRSVMDKVTLRLNVFIYPLLMMVS
jgi:hypothetical protein